jgi:hypothetical protein
MVLSGRRCVTSAILENIASLCPGLGSNNKGIRMRIMSFNVRGAYWVNDGVNHWPKRADLNSATIRKYTPDVIGFQEFQQGNHEYYQTALAEFLAPGLLRRLEDRLYPLGPVGALPAG